MPGLPPDHPARAAYRDEGTAAAYASQRFARGSGKETDRREREALSEMLDRAGLPRGALVLDCPAGAGRFADLFAARGLRVVGSDQSTAMLSHAARAFSSAGHPRRLAAADALALPFRDGAFELVLCHRLIHHLATEGQRRALLSALAAATNRWVVLSWFDAVSLQHLRRALRSHFRHSVRYAVTQATLLRDAEAAGLRPVAFRAIRPFVSEVTLALFRR